MRLLRYEVQQTEFFLSSCAIFCTFTPLTAQQMKISNMKKKNKKTWRYHHFTQVHQNHDYPLYCSRDMARDRCNCYFHFELYFSLLPPPPPPLTVQKMKISQQRKNCQEISSFYTCVPKIMIICYTVLLHRPSLRPPPPP